MVGLEPAVHVGPRQLRQRVLGVAALDQRGDAGGAQPRVVRRLPRQHGQGFRVLRVVHDPPHRFAGLAADEVGRALEELLGHLVQHDRKVVLADRQQRLRQLVDRVLANRQRGVAARVLRSEPEGEVDLLGRLDVVRDLAAVPLRAAATLVQGESGVDQLPVLGEQELDSVAGPGLLVGGERDHDVPLGDEALPAPADQVGGVDRALVLVVRRAAAVEVAVPLLERERRDVGAPVLGQGVDHVDVGHQQDRLGVRIAAAQPGHQVALRREVGRDEDADILGRKAGFEQGVGHRLGGPRVVAALGVRRVDLDELLEQGAGQGHVLGGRHRPPRRRVLGRRGGGGKKQRDAHGEDRYRKLGGHPR